MAFTTLSLGLTLTIPTNGTRNYGTTLLNTTWTKISQHSHTGSGDGNKISASALLPNIVDKSLLSKNLALWQQSVAASGTAATINWNDGNTCVLNQSGASGTVVLTLTNPIQGALYRIIVSQGATFRDITWPASVKFPQGQLPILTQTASAKDKIELYYDGTNYYADWQVDYL